MSDVVSIPEHTSKFDAATNTEIPKEAVSDHFVVIEMELLDPSEPLDQDDIDAAAEALRDPSTDRDYNSFRNELGLK